MSVLCSMATISAGSIEKHQALNIGWCELNSLALSRIEKLAGWLSSQAAGPDTLPTPTVFLTNDEAGK